MVTLALLAPLASPASSTPLVGTLVVAGLVIASVALFYAMTRSLRTARRNLGPPRSERRGPDRGRPPGPPGPPGQSGPTADDAGPAQQREPGG